MKLTIDNNSRIFQVVTSNGKQFFCNVEHIAKVVEENNLVAGYYTIYHFWGNKAKKVSKKYLKELLQANDLTHDFYY
jgi:hypothetical protein